MCSEYVSKNIPVIIEKAVGWKAVKLWDKEYLTEKLKNCSMTVDVTPNGRADAINGKHFVKPEERKVEGFGKFLEMLENKQEVCYIQHQNSNFDSEFKNFLEGDIDNDLKEYAAKMFGESDDVVTNLWIGDRRSVTSMHKDHYENFYAVIRGKKIFKLAPPQLLPYLEEKLYKSARYSKASGEWTVVEEEPESFTNWISVDVNKKGKFDLVQVEVNEGELLYLPSMWYHHVEQKEREEGDIVIAINFWHDMQFGPLFTYYKFVENILVQNLKKPI